MGKRKIIQFRDLCIGCNSCVEHAPSNWEMDIDDGKAKLKRSEEKDGIFSSEITEVEMEVNINAAVDCPAGCIKIIDENGKDITHD